MTQLTMASCSKLNVLSCTFMFYVQVHALWGSKYLLDKKRTAGNNVSPLRSVSVRTSLETNQRENESYFFPKNYSSVN